MDLERGALARLDRRLLAGLAREERFQMVRVPVTQATWSTWKRCCDIAGISMGRAIAALIDRELNRILADDAGDSRSFFVLQVDEQLALRRDELEGWERRLEAIDERLRGWSRDLSEWQDRLEGRERRAELSFKLADQSRRGVAKVGRNEACSCGSGLKHKRCHGLVS